MIMFRDTHDPKRRGRELVAGLINEEDYDDE